MKNNRPDNDAKLDAFLRGHRPRVPAAPADELSLLLNAIAPPKRSAFRRAAPLWAPGLALLFLVIGWMVASWLNLQTGGMRVENMDTATFALAALIEPAGETGDDFILRDHPLNGLAEDEGEE